MQQRSEMGFQSQTYGKIAFLGVVQGISELLPISSTEPFAQARALFIDVRFPPVRAVLGNNAGAASCQSAFAPS